MVKQSARYRTMLSFFQKLAMMICLSLLSFLLIYQRIENFRKTFTSIILFIWLYVFLKYSFKKKRRRGTGDHMEEKGKGGDGQGTCLLAFFLLYFFVVVMFHKVLQVYVVHPLTSFPPSLFSNHHHFPLYSITIVQPFTQSQDQHSAI